MSDETQKTHELAVKWLIYAMGYTKAEAWIALGEWPGNRDANEAMTVASFCLDQPEWGNT